MNAAEQVGEFWGRHVMAQLAGVDAHLLNDESYLRQLLETAVNQAKATLLDMRSHRFHPHGVTVAAILSESHAAVHTYPRAGRLLCGCVHLRTSDPPRGRRAGDPPSSAPGGA